MKQRSGAKGRHEAAAKDGPQGMHEEAGYDRGGRPAELRESCAGGVVFHDGRLLILQKLDGNWVLPKGHIEQGEAPSEAALREVLEETGVPARVTAPLGQTRYSFRRNDRISVKTVSWFLMEAEDATGLRPEQVFRQARLVHPHEALRLISFTNDRQLIESALRLRHEPAAAD